MSTIGITPAQSKIQQQLRPQVEDAMHRVGSYETAKGWLRYELMRTLNLQQLGVLSTRALKGERWDDMIDEMLVERGGVQ